jgi:cytochrome c peroxidase
MHTGFFLALASRISFRRRYNRSNDISHAASAITNFSKKLREAAWASFTRRGRALITGDPNEAFNFKIPTLWGIKDTAPYFHDNSARTLEDVMDHYTRLFRFIDDQLPRDQQFFRVLSDQDKADIVAFLKLL